MIILLDVANANSTIRSGLVEETISVTWVIMHRNENLRIIDLRPMKYICCVLYIV